MLYPKLVYILQLVGTPCISPISALGTSLCTKGLFCNFFQGRHEKLHVVYPLEGLKSYQVNHKVQAWGWRFKILTDFSIPFASWHHEYINLKCDSDIIVVENHWKMSHILSCKNHNNFHTLFEKSNFCPKIQFWHNTNIFTSFSPKFFLTLFLVKSKLSTAKKP